MVPVARVAGAFHAQVLVARLGSDGIVTQLRGGGVDGPYPMGHVEVLVSADDLTAASELLLADEVESAFDDCDDPGVDDPGADGPTERSPLSPWLVVAVLVALVLFAYVSTIGYRPRPTAGSPTLSGQQAGQSVVVEPAESPAPVRAR